MTHFLGYHDGTRADRRSFKTLDGVLNARNRFVYRSGKTVVKILRNGDDGVEVYCGGYGRNAEWMPVRKEVAK